VALIDSAKRYGGEPPVTSLPCSPVVRDFAFDACPMRVYVTARRVLILIGGRGPWAMGSKLMVGKYISTSSKHKGPDVCFERCKSAHGKSRVSDRRCAVVAPMPFWKTDTADGPPGPPGPACKALGRTGGQNHAENRLLLPKESRHLLH
jgi:hypothetical protein